MGKFFCRICHVKGTDAKAKPPILVPAPEHEQDHADPGRDLNARDDHPEPHPGVLSSTSNPTSGQPGGAVTYPDVTPSATSKKGPKKAETLDEMIDRVSRFVKVCLDEDEYSPAHPGCRSESLVQNRTHAQN